MLTDWPAEKSVQTRRDFLRRVAVAGAGIAGVSVAPALLAACRSGPAALHPVARPTPAPAGAPLRAVGGKLVDVAGHEVRLTGVNWSGGETRVFAPHGLWARNWQDMLDQIVKAGFNTIRLPFSNQLLEPDTLPVLIDLNKNPDLVGLTGLQVMDQIVEGAGARGLSVILDRHLPRADTVSELWYTEQVPEGRWVDDWVMLAQRYRHQPAVIAADLHNEPHGHATWGDGSPRTDWRRAAEQAGNAILAANPDWLIVVQGIERYASDLYWWGGNLKGARLFPVRLSHPDKLVYSAHDYGPRVYRQPWFQAADFPRNLAGIWQHHWAYLQSEDLAPVLIGEFGGRSMGQDLEGTWQRSLIDFMKANMLSYTYWSWNPDSGDTGGILDRDWTTIDRAKLDVLSTYQWPLVGKT